MARNREADSDAYRPLVISSGAVKTVTARRVLQLAKYYPPEWGGIETVTRDIAIGLAARNFKSSVVAFTKRITERTDIDGVAVIRCKEDANFASQPISLKWLIEASKEISKSDVVVMQWPNFLPILTIPFMGSRPLFIHWQSDLIDKGVLGWLLGPLQWLLLKRATRVMTSTEDYRRGSTVLARHRGKTVALPIGIEDPLTTFKAVELPPAIEAFVTQRPFILAVGRLVPYKGFDQLIAATSTIDPACAVLIVGEGPMKGVLHEMIDSAGLSNRVLLTGPVSKAVLDTLFSRAVLYVMSSNQRSEGFGVVQLEAMAHSLPIIATDVPRSGVAWVSGNGSTGAMVPINAPDAIASAANSILRGGSREEFGRKARLRFEEYFTVDKMLDRLVAIIDGKL